MLDQSWVALLVCNFGVILTAMARCETTKTSFNTQTSFRFRDAIAGSQGQFEVSRMDVFDGTGKMLPLSVTGEHRNPGDQPVSFWKM